MDDPGAEMPTVGTNLVYMQPAKVSGDSRIKVNISFGNGLLDITNIADLKFTINMFYHYLDTPLLLWLLGISFFSDLFAFA